MAQVMESLDTESWKGTRQDTPPPLPTPTTSLQEDPSPQLYRGRSEGWSTTDEEKPQLSSRSPSPDYTVGIRGWSTRGRDEPIHNLPEDQNILGSSRRPIPTPGDSKVDHHRHLQAAHQVWQGPYRAVRTQNQINLSQLQVGSQRGTTEIA